MNASPPRIASGRHSLKKCNTLRHGASSTFGDARHLSGRFIVQPRRAEFVANQRAP